MVGGADLHEFLTVGTAGFSKIAGMLYYRAKQACTEHAIDVLPLRWDRSLSFRHGG